jgi:voltage-gated potassium channel
MNIKKRLYIILLSAFIVVMTGSIGYYIIFNGQPKFMDCIYMTVVSLTTVGYGEIIEITGNVPAQIFTMVLITFGVGIILYSISTITAVIVEGELTGILRKKKMIKQIQKLKNHIIVCGGGETGRPVLVELSKNKELFVLIEQNEETIERCKSIDNLLYIQGDATEDENLMAAGIKNASGIIVVLPSDKDNLYVTMTARMLNKTIRIVSKMIDQNLAPKLKMAGANRVVSPNTIGALRMASEMIRPTVVDFLDSMLRSSRGNLRIHQITVSKDSEIVEKNLRESGIKDQFGLLVLAAKHKNEEIEFNPNPDQILTKGMTLIVMGEVDDIARARRAF